MYCKLTDQNLQTYKGYQWVIGEWKETSGEGKLCTNGWLHCYVHPLLAAFLNHIHGNIQNPRLFEIEVAGETKNDSDVKVGFTKMRLTKEIPLPQITETQRIAFVILCAKEVETNEKWLKWADNWLNGTDRTKESIHSMYDYAWNYTSMAAYDACSYANARVIYSCAAAYAASIAYYDAADAIVNCTAISKPLNLIELAEKAMTYN